MRRRRIIWNLHHYHDIWIITDSEDAQKEDEMQTELSMEDLKEAFR